MNLLNMLARLWCKLFGCRVYVDQKICTGVFLGHCTRCGKTIELRYSPQTFVKEE